MLQENHVVNGCCWLNHSGGVNGDPKTTKFIDLVREHRCIKAWFSGHFHLGQDYQDSITFPTIPRELGPYPNRGSCVFAQTSVMRAGTSRDGRQQSRLIRGNKDGFEICTIDHADGGKVRLSTQFWTGILDRNSAQFWRSHSERCPPSQVRLDATISYKDSDHEVGVYNHAFDTLEKENPNFVNVLADRGRRVLRRVRRGGRRRLDRVVHGEVRLARKAAAVPLLALLPCNAHHHH